MSKYSQLFYLGARFNDEGGEGGEEGNNGGNDKIDINTILSNRDLMSQILENSPEFKSAKEQANQANQKLSEAQRKQQEMEEASKKGKLVNEMMNGLFSDVTDEVELEKRLSQYAEIETNKAIETRDAKLKEYEEKIATYEQKHQQFSKQNFFNNSIKDHKKVNPDGHEFLFRELEGFMQVDDKGNVQYVDNDGKVIKGVDNKPITTAEFIDDLVQQKPSLQLFLKGAEFNGGFNGGGTGVKTYTQNEFNKVLYNATPEQEAEILRQRKAGEIKIV